MSNLAMFSLLVSFGIIMTLFVDSEYTTLPPPKCRAIRLTGLFMVLVSMKYFLDLLVDCNFIKFIQQ